MPGNSRYLQTLLLLCVGSTIFCAIFITFESLSSTGRIWKKEVARHEEHPAKETRDSLTTLPHKRYMTTREREREREQIYRTSLLGRWLLSSEGSLPPPIVNNKKKPFLILIWKHGKFLERRHIKRFTDKKFSPWENCTVKKCVLSYRSEDIDTADAVVFHLHLTRNAMELPARTRWDQRWIFLTDESPIHTFLYGNQELSTYNGLFNWSMSYRMNSDVPVPYGRTVSRSFINSPSINFPSREPIVKMKTKLVTVMGSNCAGVNGRWNYIKRLKEILGTDLDVYGRCLNGNATACPGHFDRDCPVLNAYKFYLAFENSNCKDYITEKVFWHGYHKLAVPVIMGAPKKDCERLLPPRSFLHVTDFADPSALANYIKYLGQHNDKYLEYHEWRKYYKVINEHGYFGSVSTHYCRICEALHYNPPTTKVYRHMESFFDKKRDCVL
ncbi:alpha-(1,3)-fucosyltransferase 5-like [Ceratina calcarata]|uniref:Fucosyltransferase n=1 Tax=Ceratina calcarata TaxID=156304 RepID=A0AAJ7NC32_9HYME|nr:alpha-(1,3)-fucosyltransferase 5-like [Ceratina calcarata]